MRQRQAGGANKGRQRAKPLAVTLLCLCLVCLAAVLPGVLVGMNDELLYDRFIPTGGARVAGGLSDETLQRLQALGAYKDSRLLVDAQAGEDYVRDAGRMEAYCTLLLGQLGLLRDAGLLTESETEVFAVLLAPTSPDLAFVVARDEDEERFVGVSALYQHNYLCELRYDAVEERALSLSLTLPQEQLGLAPAPVEPEAGLRAYIDWLGVAELGDWGIARQEEGRAIAYSPTADLLLGYQSTTTPEGMYRVSYTIS